VSFPDEDADEDTDKGESAEAWAGCPCNPARSLNDGEYADGELHWEQGKPHQAPGGFPCSQTLIPFRLPLESLFRSGSAPKGNQATARVRSPPPLATTAAWALQVAPAEATTRAFVTSEVEETGEAGVG
jgi:hypothetical protein